MIANPVIGAAIGAAASNTVILVAALAWWHWTRRKLRKRYLAAVAKGGHPKVLSD